jgi:hypothetical protein
MRYLAKCAGDSVYGNRRSATFVPTNPDVVENAITLVYNAHEKRFEVGAIYVIEVSDKQSVRYAGDCWSTEAAHDLVNPVG